MLISHPIISELSQASHLPRHSPKAPVISVIVVKTTTRHALQPSIAQNAKVPAPIADTVSKWDVFLPAQS